jgi:hypothetical protein
MVRYLPVAVGIASVYTLTRNSPEWLLVDGILYLTGTVTSIANLTFGVALYRRSYLRREPLTRGARMSTFLGSAGISIAVLSALFFLTAITVNTSGQ